MQMLIDSGLADTLALGNLLKGYSIAIVLRDDILIYGRIELGYTFLQGFQLFVESFRW